jgi:YVTN family beta-propeller protein
VAAGTEPEAIAVNPATDKIYVANRFGSNVTVIDGATNATSIIAAGTNPWTLAPDPSTNKTYVVNYGSNNVTVIDGAAIGAVALISPADNATSVSVSPTFLWNTAANAVAYNVQVSTNSAFNLPIINTTVSSTNFAISLNADTKYYWRVAGIHGGETGPWSTDSFTTTTTGILGGALRYSGATMGFPGVMAVYSVDGRRVMQIPFDASATKEYLLKGALKCLAKGVYTYRFDGNGKIMSEANMLVQ